jgi:hypothetical protein
MLLTLFQKLPHHAVLREDFTFLDAYEAQGLLEVSIFLIKVHDLTTMARLFVCVVNVILKQVTTNCSF